MVLRRNDESVVFGECKNFSVAAKSALTFKDKMNDKIVAGLNGLADRRFGCRFFSEFGDVDPFVDGRIIDVGQNGFFFYDVHCISHCSRILIHLL